MKVCGVTYTHSPNYGTCLQAYALGTAIRGIETGGEPCEYEVIPVQMLKDYPINGLADVVIKPFLWWCRLPFRKFYKEKMKYAPVSYLKQLPSLNDRFDAFICGSDVIWSQNFNKGVKAYFLDFATKYKFAYAASFGRADISKPYLDMIRPLVDRLDSIAVREQSGVEITHRCTDKPVETVADPVLLLDRKKWEAVATERRDRKPYIFVYVTHINEEINGFVKKLKRQTGLKCVWTVSGPKQAIKKGILQLQSPQRWLRGLMDAEYVVTNSFHATAFSVLFHKKFFTVVHGEKGQGINVRMNDFLNSMELEDRIFSAVPETIDLNEIQFSEADKKIEALRQKSLDYLQTNLEKAYDETHRARM